jgi:hypothetical protein
MHCVLKHDGGGGQLLSGRLSVPHIPDPPTTLSESSSFEIINLDKDNFLRNFFFIYYFLKGL